MAKEQPARTPASTKPQHKKLPRLEQNQKISKRPLLHPAIAPPRSGASTQKIIYISPSSPFIATVKRVRKLLSHIEDRAAEPISLSESRNSHSVLKAVELGIQNRAGKGGKEKGPRDEEVVLKGSGKAIEKVLRLVLYWQGQEDVVVTVRTRSVGAVDDVIEEGVETGESRVRRVSCLEVGIRLR